MELDEGSMEWYHLVRTHRGLGVQAQQYSSNLPACTGGNWVML